MKRVTLCVVLCITGLLCAEPALSAKTEALLHSFLSPENAADLLESGRLVSSRYNPADAALDFVPPFPIAKCAADGWNQGTPSYIIEILYLYKKKNTAKDTEKIARIFRSPSKLEGLEYYSASRKKMRTLYEKSYLIDNLKEKNRLEDPTDNLSPDFSAYVLQKDLSFGENIYRCRFLSDEDTAGFISYNTDVLKYSIFKAVLPENLLISVTATDLGDTLLIHCITRARLASSGMFKKRIQKSFQTRIEAVYDWFIGQYQANEDVILSTVPSSSSTN